MDPRAGCHPYEAIRPPKTPNGWRHLFLECLECFRGRSLCTFKFGENDPNPLRIWLCVPCHNARPSITDILEANSMKEPIEGMALKMTYVNKQEK